MIILVKNNKILKTNRKIFVIPEQPAGNFVTIGGREYPIVQIGRQWWMAENLDYKWEGLKVGLSGTSDSEQRANYYDNDESIYGVNGNKYGLMYNWIAVDYIEQNKATICLGWRVPSSDDFNTLANSVGGSSIAGTKLKSTTGWYESGNGDDSYGFNAFPAGTYWEEFGLVNMMAFFWTNTSTDSNNAINKYFKYDLSSMTSYSIRKYNQTSVRLCKDATVNIGGRDYPTTRIGNQVWLAENLNLQWNGLTIGDSEISDSIPKANYFNNVDNYSVNGYHYGLLYNWVAVKYIENNRTKLLPSGWRVASEEDWNTLVDSVGGTSIAGTKLKSTKNWQLYNGDGSYGFDAVPAGAYDGLFKDNVAMYWTSTETDNTMSRNVVIDMNSNYRIGDAWLNREFSIRLVKDVI